MAGTPPSSSRTTSPLAWKSIDQTLSPPDPLTFDAQSLGKLRHELRTPINQVIGYCELLLEDPNTADIYERDLQRIKTAGWQLLTALNTYLGDQALAARSFDTYKVQQDLRTPVDHIIGYSELLMEQAESQDCPEILQDLRRIHKAAGHWLQRMEAALLALADSREPQGVAAIQRDNSGLGQLEPTRTSTETTVKAAPGCGEHILIAEDDPLNLDILRRRVERFGYRVTTTGDGGSAWLELQKGTYDLVLLDMMMPIMDGFELLRHLRNDPRLSLVPVLMISGGDQEHSIARCIEAGADDYLMKPVNPIFLRARIGACLERKRLRDLEQRTHAALLESQSHLAEELAEASRYVSCLLPKPLSHPDVTACWHFQSCSQIGGDGFGYRWIDKDHWTFFLFDVCGHGVGAAMLSISILNVLRTLSLPDTDFKSPQSVLQGLNLAFPMEAHNEQYFTCWYGVYSPSTRQLRFGSAGHPPALCIEGDTCTLLRTQGPPIGAIDDARFREESRILTPSCRLIVISDGVYELEKEDGTTATIEEFSSWYVSQGGETHPMAAWEWAQKTCVREKLDDDFSIMGIHFRQTLGVGNVQ